MTQPLDLQCVIPSRVAVGEPFTVKIRVLGPVRPIKAAGNFNVRKPGLHGPFNLNVQRQIQFVDNCLPEWNGVLTIDGEGAVAGPSELRFDGEAQGTFPGDKRPIRECAGFAWTKPGFRFLRLVDPASGVEAWSNPAYVTETPPEQRLFWGDPHWQTFFSDGIRCPEELYHFARNEGFLDFGAISDHVEGLTDRQWDYFQAVTNDYNEPGRFVTLQGQEWTHHNPERGAPGHRNIYYRGHHGPILRSNDPDCDTLDKLWARLDEIGLDAIAIPHHPANTVMGVDWEQGWNAKYEKAVEIYSVWGSSEKPIADGNTRPIHALQGELAGRHVRDALAKGFRMGFVGGGDIHGGRPGDALHRHSYPPLKHVPHEQGLTAVCVPSLTREEVFDAIREQRTYATTCSRIYLDVQREAKAPRGHRLVRAASQDGLQRIVCVRMGEETEVSGVDAGARTFEQPVRLPDPGPDEYIYFRVETVKGEMAWSSPEWGAGTPRAGK